ncbi:MAG: biopolymer transporter ExbD [Chitinophagaceae bacterium]|nr:MAG: biopolymer transporter ExbD [Chitinophagaceae bacterium]
MEETDPAHLRKKTKAMASIESAALGSKRNTHVLPRIDMTPMVDLGFLLITFFIFTTSMSDNKAVQLIMPADGEGTKTMESATLSLLLDSNRVVAYRGTWSEAKAAGHVQPTSLNVYTGAGRALTALQQSLRASGRHDSDLVLLIKPTERASYQQLVDALDLALIYQVKRYAVVAPDADEQSYLDR